MNALKTFKNLEPKTQTNLSVLFATGLLFWTSITTLLPTLPAYVEDLGGTRQQVGFVMGALAIGLIFSRTWLGHLADYKSRKLVVLIGTFVAAIAPLGYLMIKSISLLIVVRAFHGISIAAFTTGYSALVTDLSPAKQRGEIIGYMSLAVPIGMAIGPALGGFLQEGSGYEALFILSAFCGLLGLILSNQVKEYSYLSSSQKPNKQSQPTGRTFWQLISSHPFLIPTLVLFLIGLLFGTLTVFLPIFLRHLDFSAGLFYTAAAIASFAVRVFVGQASDRYGRGLFITASLICYGLSMTLLAFGQSSTIFILSAIFEGTGAGILIPMILALITDRSYPHERGRVFAVCVAGFDVGIAIAGPLLGVLTWEYREIFALAAGFAGLALLLFFSQSNKNLPSSVWFALGQEKDRYALESVES